MKNPLTAEAFLDWVAKLPADEKYNYFGVTSDCAFARYLRALGIQVWGVGGDYWRTGEGPGTHRPLPSGVAGALADFPHTYGALAARLRAAL